MAASFTVDLIRHGTPVGGTRYRGQIDDPLSEDGWRQMWAAVGDGAPWQRIVSSPLSRCRAFAHALGERHEIPVLDEPRFMEVGFGAWEGLTREQVAQRDPGEMARFYADPVSQRPAGAEPLEAFYARVIEAWRDRVERSRDGDLLVVAHAGVIRVVMSHVLSMPLGALYRIQVPNAGMTRIRVHHERPSALLSHGAPL